MRHVYVESSAHDILANTTEMCRLVTLVKKDPQSSGALYHLVAT